MLFYTNFTFANINIELRHNVPTSQRSNIEQERGRNLMLGQSTFCRPGCVPIKNCEIAIFLHFHVYMYLYIYIYKKTSQIFCDVFFAKILPNHTTVSELPKRSVNKACQGLSTNVTQFNKTAVCSHGHHRGIFVPGYTFGCSIQVRATPQPSWASAPPLTTDSV